MDAKQVSGRRLKDRLEILGKKVLEAHQHKSALKSLQAELGADSPSREELIAELTKCNKHQQTPVFKRCGISSLDLVRHAELRLLEHEQLGLFASHSISTSNEFPTLLARIPVFPPLDRGKQKGLLDKDNALAFDTPFGRGRRHGPPVTTDDEDRLIALMRLRKRRVIGKAGQLPIPLSGTPYTPNGEGQLRVHWVCCTISQIHEEMNISNSGLNYETTLDSLKRLNAIVLEVETKKQSLYFGDSRKGTAFKLVDIVWELFHDHGVVTAQFSPIVALWLESQSTYLNWEVRKELKGRNARALHRFLSTQPKHYCKEVMYIAQAISWEGEKRRMMKPFASILERLVALDWLTHFEISGTGRKVPYVVDIWRK
jgi:hypothetical protein